MIALNGSSVTVRFCDAQADDVETSLTTLSPDEVLEEVTSAFNDGDVIDRPQFFLIRTVDVDQYRLYNIDRILSIHIEPVTLASLDEDEDGQHDRVD